MQYYRSSFGFGRPWTPMVRNLIAANVIIFILQLLGGNRVLIGLFALDSSRVVGHFMVWQFITYMFLHGGVFHLLFNMFGLWMFGSEMEEFFGRKEFLFYYFLTGIGAGLCTWGIDAVLGSHSVTIGASGAVFGILLAYGLVYARRQITLLLFLIIPVTLEARLMVAIFAVMEFLWGVSGDSGVAHFAHLGGMLFGYLYFKLARARVRPYFHGRSIFGDWWAGMSSRRGQSDQERLDQLLDKINRYGIHTLSGGERKFLEKMSRRRMQ